MDILTRSLYVRLTDGSGNRSNLTNSSSNCPLAEKFDPDTSIPEIFGINLAVWIVSHALYTINTL